MPFTKPKTPTPPKDYSDLSSLGGLAEKVRQETTKKILREKSKKDSK